MSNRPRTSLSAKTSGVSSKPAVADSTGKKKHKFREATTEEIKECRDKAISIAAKAVKNTIPFRLVETDHYMIYTCLGTEKDADLMVFCERMYKALCDQFGVLPEQNIYAGKCPIYLLGNARQAQVFEEDVVERTYDENLGGYCFTEGNFSYIAITTISSKNFFIETLIHESTHSFVGRYLTDSGIPTWVEEGIAEFMASKLVPQSIPSVAGRRCIKAERTAAYSDIDVEFIFTNFGDEDIVQANFEYGVAQSLVRFLISRDRKAFIKFFTLLKEDKEQEDALKETYKCSLKQLSDAWLAAAKAVHAGK